MHRALKAVPIAVILLLGGLACHVLGTRAGAVDGAPPARGARGGLLAKTQQHQFEVFFYPAGLQIFPQDSAGKPLDTTNISALAIFYHPNSPSPWFDRPLRPVAATAGAAPTLLEHSIGLGTVPASGAKVVFEISGLTDPSEPAVSFTVPFQFTAVQLRAPAAPATATASPAYVYASGFQGVGYYANPGPQTTPPPATVPSQAQPPRYSGNATRTQAGGSRPVNAARARDWTTGHRMRLHKPWLSPG